MRVLINGRQEEIGKLSTLGDLLRSRNIVPQRVAVERNGELVARDHYDTTPLVEGDHLEIVTFVGGG